MAASDDRANLAANVRHQFWQLVTWGAVGLVIAALGAATLSLLQDRSAGTWPDLFRFGWIAITTLVVLAGFTFMIACLARVAGEAQARLDARRRDGERTRETL